MFSEKFKDWVARIVIVIVSIIVICGLASLWITTFLLEDCDLSWELGRNIGLFCFAVSTVICLARVCCQSVTVKKIAIAVLRFIVSEYIEIKKAIERCQRRSWRRKQKAIKRRREAYRRLYE